MTLDFAQGRKYNRREFAIVRQNQVITRQIQFECTGCFTWRDPAWFDPRQPHLLCRPCLDS